VIKLEVKTAIDVAIFIANIYKNKYNEKRMKLIENKLNALSQIYPNFLSRLLASEDQDIYFCFENKTRSLFKSIDYKDEELVYDFILFLINKYLEDDFKDLKLLEEIIRNFSNADYKYLIHFLETVKKSNDELIFKGPTNINNVSYNQFYNELVFMEFGKLDYCILNMTGARYASESLENKRSLPYDISGCFKNEKTEIIRELYEEFLNSNMYKYRLECNNEVL
jgi:hypothetical protein